MSRLTRIGLALLIVAGATALSSITLRGHGPYPFYFQVEGRIDPPHLEEYVQGDVGIVRPWFRRRYLVQAYRVFTGLPPLAVAGLPEWEIWQPDTNTGNRDAFDLWFDGKSAVLGTATTPQQRGQEYFSSYRDLADYQRFENCNADAFATAGRTLADRRARFGAASAELKAWVTAQVAVFANCSGTVLVLPQPAPPSAPPLVRADRDYQTAAAYFYATEYDEAARRFTAIAADASSPWRPYGRYLAARAYIRHATIHKMDASEAFARAERALTVVLDDPAASRLHASARGLREFIAVRTRTVEQLRTLTAVLASPQAKPTRRQMANYQWLMDRMVGDRVSYGTALIDHRDELIKDDLNDWILALQPRDQDAFDRALARWSATRSPHWLVPVLWTIPPDHARLAEVLRAAGSVGRETALFPTLAYLRVKLLVQTGRLAEARRVLQDVPRVPQRGFQAETINVFNAARLRTAESFEELLQAAPRTIVDRSYAKEQAPWPSVFDHDGAVVFSHRLPLSLLLQAARSTALPERLRIRVAAAGLTRGLIARDGAKGSPFATVLRELRPALQPELDAYLNAPTDDERRIAALVLLIHTPGLNVYPEPFENELSYDQDEPRRTFSGQSGWWCPGPAPEGWDRTAGRDTGLAAALYQGRSPGYPSFLNAADRATVEREAQTIAAIGPARNFIAAEAIRWARLQPANLKAAEALSIAVNGWRRSCGGPSDLPRQAFTLLHRQFPNSEWAKKTKYWYQ